MNKEFILAIDQIVKSKGISKESILDALEKALIKSYEKNFQNNDNVKVDINSETGEIKVFSLKTVSDEALDTVENISLEEAKKIDPNFQIGDIVQVEITPKNFGRIAAQTARNIILQKIKDLEKDKIYDEFADREKELITGVIQRIDNGFLFIDLGKIEGMCPPQQQIPGEEYKIGDRKKFFIEEVKNTSKGTQVILSRSSSGLVVRLFELEVPEINEGVVEIYSISREAGSRTKISVFTNNPDVDPVGACVGYKGARVKTIVDELNEEKIDIIVWNNDPRIFIANSLSPSEVNFVLVNKKENVALAVVPDNQLSLAIGKEGQNVRLAARLTSWKIDIKGHEKYNELLENNEIDPIFLSSLDDIDGNEKL